MRTAYTLLLSFLIFLLVFIGYFHQVTAFTQDLGRHLLLGKIIFTTHLVPTTNLLSYTYPSFPFLNHHYLSEVLFYLITTYTGIFGLLSITTLLMLLSFGLLFFFSYRRTGISTLPASLLIIPILFERTDIRPEMFSYFFFSLFLVILYKNRNSQTKLLSLLPLITLLWVNMHIYFFMGILLVFLFFIDGLLKNRRNLTCRYNKQLLTILILTLCATLINPQGITGALYPLTAFQNYGYAIEENQNIFFLESLGFHKNSVEYFKFAVVLLFMSLILRNKNTRPIDWLLALTFSIAGAVAVRNLPLFALASLIPIASNLKPLLKKLSAIATHFPLLSASRQVHLFFLLLCLFSIWQMQVAIHKNAFGFSVNNGAAKAVNFIETHHIRGPIFNNFDIGSYLAYRLYPREKVFVDGRPEAYPETFFQKIYIPIQQDKSSFADAEKTYNFSVVFFTHTDQTPWAEIFLKDMLQNPSWKVVYLDETVIIFLKDIPRNRQIIQKYGMDHTALNASYNQLDTQSLLQLASFFERTDDLQNLFPVLQRLLILDPTNCQALYNRASIAINHHDPLASSYTASYERTCNKRLLQ
ncbi:MAG: hypothetical protein RLZZ455_297 [Candidatus Parcubacteria bacterium]|jgi:hypothetical protein